MKKLFLFFILMLLLALTSAANAQFIYPGGIGGAISDTAYDATTWDGVTTVSPSKNAVRDKLEALAPGGLLQGIPIVAAGGTVDAITATYSPAITLADKMIAAFVALGANTITNPTFAPNGLTSHTIVKQGGVALVVGDIPRALYVCLVEYNLANTRWELLNPAFDPASPGAIGGTTPGVGTFTQVNMGYATVASHATTSAIWAAAGNVINFTGAETITNFPAAPQAGAQRVLICAGAAVFTHGGAITVLGGATYTAVAGDIVTVTAITTTAFQVTPRSGRIKFPGGANEDGIVFGNLGTATKGIDLSSSGLSGDTDYWIYGGGQDYWSSSGKMSVSGTSQFFGVHTNEAYIIGSHRFRQIDYMKSTDENQTLRLGLITNTAFLTGNFTAVGSLTSCTSNGTATITKTTHGLTLAAGELVHITGATTTADKGFYRIISSGASTIVVDRALAGSDADVALTVYKDVVSFHATDGTNGQMLTSWSAQNKPLQLGGTVLAATGHSLASPDVLIGGKLEVDGDVYLDGNLIVGANKAYLWLPAGTMTPITSAGLATVNQNPNMTDYLAFDGATDEYAGFTLSLEDWDLSTIKAKFVWYASAAMTNAHTVIWGLNCYAVSDGDTSDVAFDTGEVTVSDAYATGDETGPIQKTTAATAAITVQGTPAAGDVVYCRPSRKASTDTSEIDAWLVGVKIEYGKTGPTAW